MNKQEDDFYAMSYDICDQNINFEKNDFLTL